MELKNAIQNELKSAMKSKDTVRLDVIRMLTAEIKKREIDKKSVLDEGEILKTIQTLIKQRTESKDAFLKGNRPELAEKEQKEIEILKAYLPAQMSAEEVETAVLSAIEEVGAKNQKDIGKVMKAVLAKVGGRADGKMINEIARAKLPAA